jgi:hypothetical protein
LVMINNRFPYSNKIDLAKGRSEEMERHFRRIKSQAGK